MTVESQPNEQLEYQPAARRPIADLFRATAHLAVRICIRLGIHPDAVSYLSLVASAAAAICFWQAGSAPWLLIPAAGMCYVRLWLNMLDGMVALASGKASPRGEILNDLPDRISDVLIFVGAAHSGLGNPFGGYWAAIFALLTAYVGTLGQAVGGKREFGGVMSKPWRMVALHVGSWLLLADLWLCGWTKDWKVSILDWTHFCIIAGCVQTIIVRLLRILSRLRLSQ
ncbi:MAG: CDP-alcohol phosphatidyltransferase family protein [Pirellulaceae bacterium]|nr:CDP-alcohol phosphatidyltransferase family protein [Pirellulaceae bacterium]